MFNKLKGLFNDTGADTDGDNITKEQREEIKIAKKRFKGSAIQAREAGVPEDKILKTKEDIDNYFMN